MYNYSKFGKTLSSFLGQLLETLIRTNRPSATKFLAKNKPAKPLEMSQKNVLEWKVGRRGKDTRRLSLFLADCREWVVSRRSLEKIFNSIETTKRCRLTTPKPPAPKAQTYISRRRREIYYAARLSAAKRRDRAAQYPPEPEKFRPQNARRRASIWRLHQMTTEYEMVDLKVGRVGLPHGRMGDLLPCRQGEDLVNLVNLSSQIHLSVSIFRSIYLLSDVKNMSFMVKTRFYPHHPRKKGVALVGSAQLRKTS